jgi:site-specific DNA-adenine methylase
VEPFAGSLATLLARPDWTPGKRYVETVNDLNLYVVNFWRSIKNDPEAVAYWADYPILEADLHARHAYLTGADTREWRDKVRADSEHYDAKLAAYWVWGLCLWIGTGWCSEGEHSLTIPHIAATGKASPHLMGVHSLTKQLPMLNANDNGTPKQMGVHSHGMRSPAIAKDAEVGVHAVSMMRNTKLHDTFINLHTRLRYVRVTCGDWARLLRPSITTHFGLTAVLLDPPYAGYEDVYVAGKRKKGDPDATLSVSMQVRQWALSNGANPLYRIAVCGYGTEHDELLQHGWIKEEWKANGGFGNQNPENQNRHLERIWFSPHCLPVGEPVNPKPYTPPESDHDLL